MSERLLQKIRNSELVQNNLRPRSKRRQLVRLEVCAETNQKAGPDNTPDQQEEAKGVHPKYGTELVKPILGEVEADEIQSSQETAGSIRVPTQNDADRRRNLRKEQADLRKTGPQHVHEVHQAVLVRLRLQIRQNHQVLQRQRPQPPLARFRWLRQHQLQPGWTKVSPHGQRSLSQAEGAVGYPSL